MLCSTCFFEINFHTFLLKMTIFQDTIENVTFIFIRRSAVAGKKHAENLRGTCPVIGGMHQ